MSGKTDACDLCGAEHAAVLLSRRVSDGHVKPVEISLLACQSCGLVYLDPAAAIPQGSDYWEGHSSAKSKVPTDALMSKLRERARAIYDRVTGRFMAAGNLLDVGAGPGAMLQVFEAAGWTCTGVEPSQDYADYARTQSRSARVLCSQFENASVPTASFDLITISHVLEHAESPTQFLTVARRLVNPQGLIYIEVPDLMAIPWHFHLWEYAELAHRFYFTERTLSTVLRKTGWRVESIARTTHGGHLAAVAAPSDGFSPETNMGAHYDDIRRFVRLHLFRRPFAFVGRSILLAVVGERAARSARRAITRATAKRGR